MANTSRVADHFYGAFLIKILQAGSSPKMIDDSDSMSIYDILTDKGEYRTYLKYRWDKNRKSTDKTKSGKRKTNTWQFKFSFDNVKRIEEYLNNSDGADLILGFICAYADLKDSELAILTADEYRQLVGLLDIDWDNIADLKTEAFTISIQKVHGHHNLYAKSQNNQVELKRRAILEL